MDVHKLVKRYEGLKAVRDGAWLSIWRDVRKFVRPSECDYLAEGGARGEDIFDTSAVEYAYRLAAGMYSWMLDPTKRLIELGPADDELAKDDNVKLYFAEVTRIVVEQIANSSWATATIQMLIDIASGLDGVVFTDDDGVSPVNMRSFPIESICYAEDRNGNVNTVFRELEMTSAQMLEVFEEGELPEEIRDEAKDPAKQDRKHKLLHAVFPRQKRDDSLLDNKNMPYADIYIELKHKKIIFESGFMEFPYCICRFEKSNKESYGRGPGLKKLPDIKMLNRMRQSYIIGTEHTNDPDTLIPDASIENNTTWNKKPGAVHVYKPDVNGSKPEYMLFPANLNQAAADIQAERQGIKEGFFLDIFDPLGDLKNITATEAEIRNEGKIVPFAPIVGNVHRDYLAPSVHRHMGIASRRGLLPEMPEKLREKPEYKINYVSKIALAIKKLEALGWIQTEASIANIVGAQPDTMDNFEPDEIVRDIAVANGTPPRWIRPVQKRDEIRAARAEQQKQAEQAALLAQGAALAPDLAKAPEPGSLLSGMMSEGM